MKTITLNKIASVTKNASLGNEVQVTEHITAEEGALLAVKVLEDKKIYNQLELATGRMSTMHEGDVLAVALGRRRALKGFVGDVPKSLQVGDIINVLNLGGVSGVVTSENVEEVGHALKVEVLGAISDGKKALNIKDFALFTPLNDLEKSARLIVISGTCMNVGKTTVASEVIKQATRAGLKVMGMKLSGVATMRDVESMRDYGAIQVTSFIDAGLPSTVGNDALATAAAKGAIQYLSTENPDLIVIEFGDGLYGEYGVMATLKDPQIQKCIAAHIGCAQDPMGAAKLAEVSREIGAPLDVISGPITDNSVGCDFIRRELDLPAFNAHQHSKDLFDYLFTKCLKK